MMGVLKGDGYETREKVDKLDNRKSTSRMLFCNLVQRLIFWCRIPSRTYKKVEVWNGMYRGLL